jgi:tRNA threonylcarbamoyl adenosine modification protein (Sua5/YciO/YrdC/YwlC family)
MLQHYRDLANPAFVTALRGGAVGVIPTDTVYGLVCVANNDAAVARLYVLKHREKKPGTIIAANIEQLEELGLKARYLKAVAHYWPGSISVVIPCVNLVKLHQGVGSLAVRIPSDKKLSALLEQTGPLVTTSANLPGQPPAQTTKEAEHYFGDRVDFYVDGGNLHDREPSTVIRVVDDAVEVLREGAVIIDEETGQVIAWTRTNKAEWRQKGSSQ